MSSECIAVLPGDGWRCRYGVEGQPVVDTPVIGWAVRADGGTAALVMIGGTVTALLRREKALLLYHPSDTVTGSQEPGDARRGQ